MDALTPVAHESQCEVCGYPRIGLPDQARCPECGEPPPRRAEDRPDRGRRARLAPADGLTAGAVAHARAVGVGLLLLVVSSVSALSVTLVMDIGPMTIPALNVPAPKLHAAALVQRSIGGRPGPWGISGTTAALLAVLGIWLITTPRSLTADEEPPLSLRRLARWSAVIGVGGALGLLLSGADPYIPPRGNSVGSWLALMVLFCELPANGLLYAYLWRLARDAGDRRAALTLQWCACAVPGVTLGAGAILVYAMTYQAARAYAVWPVAARVGVAVYAAAAVGVGAAATAGVLRLLGTTSLLAFGGWPGRAGATLGRLPRGLRVAVDAVRREPARWAVFAGLLLWFWAYWDVAGAALAAPTRAGTDGQVPMLDFPGPKVPLAILAGTAAQRYGWSGDPLVRTMLLILGAVWLMAWPDFGRLRRGPAVWTRRAILVLCALALAAGTLASARVPHVTRHPRVVAFAVASLSTAATALVYLRLAAVASAVGRRDLGWRLAVFGGAAAVLDLVPLGAFRFNPHGHGRSFAYGLMCAAQVAAMFVLTLYCLGTLVRLAWVLAVGREGSGETTPPDGESAGGTSDRPVAVTLPAVDYERLVRPRLERGSV